MAADRLAEVLDATYECLARYGVKRTTMDDIAGAAGMSRAAVYQYVRNKDDAFRRLAARYHDWALADARRAAATPATTSEQIRGVLAAKLTLVLGLAGDSPHTAELLDARTRLFGDICHRFTADIRGLLVELFAASGITSMPPTDAADVCIALVVGLADRPDAARLLQPGTTALIDGLLAPATRPT